MQVVISGEKMSERCPAGANFTSVHFSCEGRERGGEKKGYPSSIIKAQKKKEYLDFPKRR